MRDPYLYKDVDVLKNKFDIKDEETLNKLERDITISNLADIDTVTGNFDYEHYKNIHKFIFGDIYDWAGTEREIEMHKGEQVLGGMSVQYTYPTEIKKTAEKCLKDMNSRDWLSMPLDKRAEQFAVDVSALWKTHPFREGNTRTTITFACQFADAHGFPMDRQIFADNSKYTRNALVLASIQPYSEYEHLTKIFKDSMERGAEKQLNHTDKAIESPSVDNNTHSSLNAYVKSYAGSDDEPKQSAPANDLTNPYNN